MGKVTIARKVTIGEGGIHYATAKVGKDIIENARYLVFEHEIFDREKTFKDKLEDLWDTITIPYYVVKRHIRNVYWEIRYGFERMFKGYDSVDTFETFYKFTERYYKILTEYRKNHIGYVGTMTVEEWDNIIDEMIYHLYYMDEDNVVRELKNGVPENWSPALETTHNIMEEHKNKFFKLFSEYFYNLWD